MQKFLRFGEPPENGISKNYRDGVQEAGVSCFKLSGKEIIIKTPWEIGTLGTISDRKIYIMQGEEIGSGSDGESIIKISSFKKAGTNQVFFAELPWGKAIFKNKTKKEKKEEKIAKIKKNGELCIHCNRERKGHSFSPMGIKCGSWLWPGKEFKGSRKYAFWVPGFIEDIK